MPIWSLWILFVASLWGVVWVEGPLSLSKFVVLMVCLMVLVFVTDLITLHDYRLKEKNNAH